MIIARVLIVSYYFKTKARERQSIKAAVLVSTCHKKAAHVNAIHSSKKWESKKRSNKSILPAGIDPAGPVPCCLGSAIRLFMPRIGILQSKDRPSSCTKAL